MIVSPLRRCAPVLALAVLVAALAGCSSTLSDAATVEYSTGAGAGTMHVNLNDFEKELKELTGSAKFREVLDQNQLTSNESSADSRFTAIWLGDLVTQTAVDREFEARGLKLTEADVTTAAREITAPSENDPPLLAPYHLSPDAYKSFSKSYQRTLAERRARGDAVIKSYATPKPEEIRAFYEDNKSVFACKRVSHVLVKTEAEAQKVLADLKAGKSFADVAKASSTDTGSAAQGGDLGCLQPGAFVEAFQTAAETAPLDTPVGPIKTEFGYHVILVKDQLPTLEQMSQQISQALSQGASVKQALSTAKVSVNPRFGSPGGVQGNQQTGVLEYQLRPPVVPDIADQRDATTTTTTTVPLG